MASRTMRIYRNRWHLAATFALIVLPLAYLYLFSRTSGLPIAGLTTDLGASMVRMVIAYCIAAVLGWIMAVLFYRGRRAAVALPIFDVLQSVPIFAALPLVTILLGPSNATVIFFLVLAIIWPVFFSVVSALKLIRQDWEDAAWVAGLRGWHYVRLFLWPASLSGLATGSIVGLGEGWEALVATEIIVHAQPGLGVFFSSHTDSSRLTLLGMLGLLLVVFTINKLVWLPLLEHSHHNLEE